VATEKLYGDYQVLATNPGGHSSLPKPDNAIYHVADALAALEKTPFLFELNSVTREYFAQMAATLSGPTAAICEPCWPRRPDAAAIARLSQDARYNATLRTTCVATMMSAGHAPNALPKRAKPNVNCRIFPGIHKEEIRLQWWQYQRSNAHRPLPRRWRRLSIMARSQGDAAPPLRTDVMVNAAQRGRKVLAGCDGRPDHDEWASDSAIR